MNDRLTVKISMAPYLKAFLLSIYHQEPPIFFPKKDKFNDLLHLLLRKQPKNHIYRDPECDYLEIIIPYFEDINIMSYNYLSQEAQRIFCKRVNMIFWSTFEDFMDECFRQDMKRNDSIYLFIEKYHLPEDSKIVDRIRKELYRSKSVFRKYPKRDYCRKR